MKNILFIITFLSTYNFSFSQKLLKGKIYDFERVIPIEYCNIGVENKDLGSLSNSNGEFSLDTSQIAKNDTILFSHLGYKNFKVSFKKLKEKLKTKDTLFLSSSSIVLDDVKIENYKFSKKMIYGYDFRHPRVNWSFKNFRSGSEICRYFENKNILIIDKLIFQVNKNELKNLKLRVNFYDIVNGKPNEKLNIEDIFIETKHHQGRLKFNLKNYNIILDSDFFISLEAVDVEGNGEFLFGGEWFGENSEEGKTYARKSSFDVWADEFTTDGSNIKQKVPHSIAIRLKTRINTK
ncbi:carboxypeptidase-like regulatory domain-containing protein [Tenacibaculum sp. SG-28]|uniref:carboxypeptidase-like regulatory domain-containing protein n=1 Tax=Tenacibaculum sp. SG-28 TaxID=754426 RepID=UPI000CF50B7C|nr:carboxypeptidase-like regulatory domain-containing protein [Tenacibaculum sp. SG-28]